MKQVTTALLILLSCGSIASPVDQAFENFTYRPDRSDEWIRYANVDKPFKGDCEDFAFTLQNMIGGDVWYTFTHEGIAHAVLVKDDMVYDTFYHITEKSEYPGKFMYIMDFNSRLK